jgi:hypothetical protein
MAKRERNVTEKKIREKIAAGHGTGERENYQPWLTTLDVASEGSASRIDGTKIRREHHLLSQHEKNYFLVLEWSDKTVDIREQYPLERSVTQQIANFLGLSHPADPKTKIDVVMTSDFNITVQDGAYPKTIIRSAKLMAELADTRVVEKLEIERRYWCDRSIDWGIVTEKEVNSQTVKNIDFFRKYLDLESTTINREILQEASPYLEERLRSQKKSLREVCKQLDHELGFEKSTSLVLTYHLIAIKAFTIDLTKSFKPSEQLVLLG